MLRARTINADEDVTLPLHPAAPQELVTAVATLIARRGGGHNVRRWFAAPEGSRARSGHYGELCISRDADSEVIALAFEVMARGANADRARIEEAYRVLSNRQLRARYDVELGVSDAPSSSDLPPQHPAPPAMASAALRSTTRRPALDAAEMAPARRLLRRNRDALTPLEQRLTKLAREADWGPLDP